MGRHSNASMRLAVAVSAGSPHREHTIGTRDTAQEARSRGLMQPLRIEGSARTSSWVMSIGSTSLNLKRCVVRVLFTVTELGAPGTSSIGTLNCSWFARPFPPESSSSGETMFQYPDDFFEGRMRAYIWIDWLIGTAVRCHGYGRSSAGESQS